ncbi:HD domain-containing protein [Chelatococcus reniformis]|uniref:HD/PDEase domain-containing protein n=1 Tax=Chelatococcus reniformis TaxID=1494448 RepID=A0A916TX13_9HYPH|nr:HD domain-containing protein [Chelatococcus reniformis]GGC48947.1 hypothetical protein GCM10010994_05140 [Chelatococcus reniformis]
MAYAFAGELLPSSLPSAGTLRSGEPRLLHDEFIRELLESRAMRRLLRIGFLGAIDHVRRGSGRAPHRRRHSRHEHSVGVAELADMFSRRSPKERIDHKLLLAAALLHDVGHGPLSHTLEPVFESEFGINHHIATELMVRGEIRLGLEIAATLKKHTIDPNEVIALINGRHSGPMNFLFGGQINLDTLEGITRSRAFFKRTAPTRIHETVAKMAASGQLPTAELDEFWNTKHHVYHYFIHANDGLILDQLAQAYMRDNLAKFSADDFFRSERQLRARHPFLFTLFNVARDAPEKLKEYIPAAWLNVETAVKRRAFHIDCSVALDSVDAINSRYSQTKAQVRVSLGELIIKK